MPHIEISCPRLTRAAKARVVAGVTEAYCEATGHGADIVVVHVNEHPYDNVGVGGRLLSDAYPELRERPWYHALEDPQP